MNKLILNFKSKDSKKLKNPKNFLGGKGANLSEMGKIGLPVPPGFTISTKVCELFYKDKKKLNSQIVNIIKKELKIIEKEVGKKFGDLKNPLLLSVRSGARVSMPGIETLAPDLTDNKRGFFKSPNFFDTSFSIIFNSFFIKLINFEFSFFLSL